MGLHKFFKHVFHVKHFGKFGFKTFAGIGSLVGTAITLIPIPGSSIVGGAVSIVFDAATGNFVGVALDAVTMIPGATYAKLANAVGGASDAVKVINEAGNVAKAVDAAIAAKAAKGLVIAERAAKAAKTVKEAKDLEKVIKILKNIV
jgi:hypothetical protein